MVTLPYIVPLCRFLKRCPFLWTNTMFGFPAGKWDPVGAGFQPLLTPVASILVQGTSPRSYTAALSGPEPNPLHPTGTRWTELGLPARGGWQHWAGEGG